VIAVVKLLFADVHILGIRWFIENGYVYIVDENIEAVGEGEPPPEYQYAEMVGGGRDRLVIPGFTAYTIASSYPFRALTKPPKLYKVVSKLSYEQAYYASLLAFYELSVSGFTAVMSVEPNPEPVARALYDSGLGGLILIPLNCVELRPIDDPKKLLDDLLQKYKGRVRVGLLTCSSEHLDWVPEDVVVVSSGLPRKLVWNPWLALEEDVEASLTKLVLEPSRYLGLGEPLKPKSKANLIVVDVSEPPAWIPSLRFLDWKWLAGSVPRIETVVSWGNLVVDGGNHLYIGLEACRKAKQVLVEAIEKLADAQ